jgi:SpoVK/Ycf46/Vps4 family AAA+-type ATPase
LKELRYPYIGKGEEDIYGCDIKEVRLTKTQESICRRITSIANFFFRGGYSLRRIPFRGFLLEGPPGNGKTEIAKQAVRRLALELGHVYLRFVDSAKVAKPRWGEAEEALANQFEEEAGKHVVLLLDDVDCLLIKRGSELAKEWHYSINALLFHKLDNITNPANLLVIATTNRPKLIDYALRSRLYSIFVPLLSIEELELVARDLLEESWPLSMRSSDEELKEEVVRAIIEELKKKKHPSIRDVQHLVVTQCIERGVWKA